MGCLFISLTVSSEAQILNFDDIHIMFFYLTPQKILVYIAYGQLYEEYLKDLIKMLEVTPLNLY